MTLVELPPIGVRPDGLADVPSSAAALHRRDFASGEEVRWCPGCGDYAVLAAVQGVMPELGIRRENTVFVSGIGCSSRFPYYMNTYGMHSIHGRAPAIATGLATTRPDLSVWVVTGDGDALSIGGNHLIHALRRNVNLTILLFNNRVYGLTKGQYSPTSASGTVTKSSPLGSVDAPFDPVALALGAGATFVARTVDSDRAHLSSVLQAAARHRGTSLVEIYQNCPVFNDGAFDSLKDPDTGAHRLIRLEHGEPVRFGEEGSLTLQVDPSTVALRVVAASDATAPLIHDAHADDPSAVFSMLQLAAREAEPLTPVGIFRDVDRPAYDDLVRQQCPTPPDREPEALQRLLDGSDSWIVGDGPTSDGNEQEELT